MKLYVWPATLCLPYSPEKIVIFDFFKFIEVKKKVELEPSKKQKKMFKNGCFFN